MNEGAHPIHIHNEELEAFVAAALEAVGLPGEDAATAAGVIVDCDRRGVSTHGVVALPAYIEQIKRGGINPRPRWRVVADRPGVARIDGDAAMGQLNGVWAMRVAIEKAKATGIGSVTVSNSNHFGGGATFALLAADAGMIGEVYSNARPCMTIPGAVGRVLGNNPLCLAAPAGSAPPIVLDMALSTVAYGKVAEARRSSRALPLGWIIDGSGQDTNDASQWQHGAALTPAAGHKGYGLSLFVELITGVIGGGGITHDLHSFRREPDRCSDVTHTFRATDIETFMPIDEYENRVARLSREVKAARLRPGVEAIFLPGERGAERARLAVERGVPVAESTYRALQDLGSELSITVPSPTATL